MIRMFRRLESVQESGYFSLDLDLEQFRGGNEARLEWGYYIETDGPLNGREMRILRWLLTEPRDPRGFSDVSFLANSETVVEVGPRLNFETTWSSNAVNICQDNGISAVTRLERSLRIGFNTKLSKQLQLRVAALCHDRMTHMVYDAPPRSLRIDTTPQSTRVIPLIEEGMPALERLNTSLGLAMDGQDMVRFYELFVHQLGRNPTDVELFQLGQGNSEHSRHGFFTGRLVIDGEPIDQSLMSIVKEPWRRNPGNSLIAFGDDSSAIRGYDIWALMAPQSAMPGPLRLQSVVYHLTCTSETHNHPTGVEPFEGAATGTGGRLRDVMCIRAGGLVGAGGVGYAVSTLQHPSLDFAWPADNMQPSSGTMSPIDILIQASDGASAYGNRFGEPVIYGFTRMFGQETPDGPRAWLKPILYTVGAGQLDDRHADEQVSEPGMLIVRVGGPAYRIGMGGGAASSMMAGENLAELDFDSVQRGNPEMGQRVYRVFRSCVELGYDNPIVAAHDLGAGGDSNALPEIAYPLGATIDLRTLPVGDSSLSVLEIWGNEAQERCAMLVTPVGLPRLRDICEREGVPLVVVGTIACDGKLVVHDSADNSRPVELPLEPILGETAPKTIQLTRTVGRSRPLLPDVYGESVDSALRRVLQLPAVGSKAYLTRKVDRCVTGLVAQQQCVGPNQLPLSDYAVIAQSHFGSTGSALSLGEQPLKGLVCSKAMARMAVAEALLNMSGACISGLRDIKLEANWMWPAKLPGEGARMYDAACALGEICMELGIAIDGGKDSLSMAARAEDGRLVKAPGQLVVAAYASMPDVSRKVTPDFKQAGNVIVFVELSHGLARLGGSALAQAYLQVGDDVPDVDDISLLKSGFLAIQELVRQGLIVSAHDRSDGGLITALLEMAFAGNLSFSVVLDELGSAHDELFTEEIGVVLECRPGNLRDVLDVLDEHSVSAATIGVVTPVEQDCRVAMGESVVWQGAMTTYRGIWERTSSLLDRLQANPECVEAETRHTEQLVQAPKWQLSFAPGWPSLQASAAPKPRIAVLREQGTNGDREMAAAFHMAGFEVWDVTMRDLINGKAQLSQFRGIAFPGGFSYGDVLDAGKGWAGKIRFNPSLAEQFTEFYDREDAFSFGVCNGAQLMTLLGWVPGPADGSVQFVRNVSGRFESRLATVKILPSPAIMLRDMAGSTLGVWVAHGEGYAHGAADVDPSLAPIRYVDPQGNPTEAYPFNPNGSFGGVTAFCSPDGRHLAMMPHPERLAHQLWQWPWMPDEWRKLQASPWSKIFQNAHQWCVDSPS